MTLRGILAGASLLATLAFLASSPALAAAAECPNEAIREAQGIAQGSAFLPDCMAYELVSPPSKGSQYAKPQGISPDGERILFVSPAALDDTRGLSNPTGDLYVATRAGGGWSTAATAAPAEYIHGSGGVPNPEALTPDFGAWLALGATEAQTSLGAITAFEGRSDGTWLPISPLLAPTAEALSIHDVEGTVLGASADLSHLIFAPGNPNPSEAPPTSYLPGDPVPAGTGADKNAYVAFRDHGGEPSVALLARDSSGKVWGGNCGARLGGAGASGSLSIGTGNGNLNQGAVSADGSRIYFSTRPSQPAGTPCVSILFPLRILQRLETPTGPEISELFSSECTRVAPEEPCASPSSGSDFYQGASADGSKVYFTTTRQLTNGDLDTGTECSHTIGASQGCDLYLYDSAGSPGHRLTLVSEGETHASPAENDPTPGEGADVLSSITAISGDGSHAYFVAQGVLTRRPNPEGKVAAAGELNLYAYDAETGHTAFIGDLDKTCREIVVGTKAIRSDCKTLFGSQVSYTDNASAVPMLGRDAEGREVGGDGHVLVFGSFAPLTANDTDGLHEDVFRYDADAETLQCVSCAPGGDDSGAFDVSTRTNLVPPMTEFAERARWVSEDGSSTVFRTDERLVPSDTDGERSPYLWREGRLTPLPGNPEKGQGGGTGEPDISQSGNEVTFSTFTSLLPEDGDTAEDVYVVRADGGFPIPTGAAPCQGEACQGSPTAAPAGPGAASASFSGPGNVKPKPQKKKHAKKKHAKHHKKHRKGKGHGKKGKHARSAHGNRRAGK